MMVYNQITFNNIRQLTFINQLLSGSGSYGYIALIQYDDIIDYLLLKDQSAKTLQQLSYYLFIAYDIRSFNDHNIKILPIGNQGNDQSIFDIMNAYIGLIAYDDIAASQAMDHCSN